MLITNKVTLMFRVQRMVVQSLSHVRFSVIPGTLAHQAPLFFTISWSLLKLISTEPTLCDPMVCSLPGSSARGIFPGKNTTVGYHVLLQGVFLPNPGIKPRSSTFQVVSLPSEPPGKPMIEQPIPSPGDVPDPGIKLGSPALQVDSLQAGLPGKPMVLYKQLKQLIS